MPDIVIVDTFDQTVDRKSFPAGRPFAINVMEGWPEGWPDNEIMVIDSDRKVYDAMAAGPMIMNEGDEYTVALGANATAAAAVVGFLSKTAFGQVAVWQLLLTAVTLAANFLLAPKIPNLNASYEWEQETSGQFFSAQSNQLRIGARVPDVFGVTRIWPDLIVEPWIEYDGTNQNLKELYVVSNGECDVTDPRISSENADANAGALITVFKPGQSWPTQDQMPIYRTNSFVGSVALPGPNNTSASLAAFTLSGNTITTNITDYFTTFTSAVGSYFRLVGDNVDSANKEVLFEVTGASSTTLNINPAIPTTQTDITGVQFRGANEVAVDLVAAPILFTGVTFGSYWYYSGGGDDYWTTSGEGSYNGTNGAVEPGFSQGSMWNPTSGQDIPATWGDLSGSYYTDQPSLGGVPITGKQFRGLNPGGDFYFVKWLNDDDYNPDVPSSGLATSVFSVPGDPNRIEFDIEFPGGLYQQNAGQPPIARAVTIRMYYRVKGTGTWTTYEDFEFSDLTRMPRRFTRGVDVTQDNAGYECYFARQTEEIDENGSFVAVDACQLIGLRGRQEFSAALAADTLNVTLVLLELRSQDVGQVVRQRDFSVVASRILPDNSHDNDTARAGTDTIEQAVLYTLMDQGGYDVANIRRDRLAAIQTDMNAITGGSAGKFNGIIDQTMTMEDQTQLLVNIGRIMTFRRGSTIDFNRNKQNQVPVRLISSRNKVSPETRVLNFGDSNEATSVILRYMNSQDDFKEATVQYPTGAGADINPEEQSVLGITDPIHAERMAQFLWDKKTYQRDSLTVEASDDGILLSPGEVIAVSDHLKDLPPIDGDVEDVTGTVWTFDDVVTAGTYNLRITDEKGELHYNSQVVVAAETNTIDLGVAAPTLPSQWASVGFRYSFHLASEDAFDLYIVESIEPVKEGPVTLNCSAYRDETYQSDTAVIT